MQFIEHAAIILALENTAGSYMRSTSGHIIGPFLPYSAKQDETKQPE